MSWAWEYVPDEAHVIDGLPPVLVKDVEEKAAEPVRAAEALHLDGTAYEGTSPQGGNGLVADGMFVYQVVPRHERVYIFQVTAW
ncbi:hypothetical protein SMD11_4750 [Streptomyces albireticuli]|uniref:Uncharacterized protein n=1 Tax=Streptomyces albireticuli TaxID=1940 RepID=A0A1Z2L7T7_9ACTN|nr:hypothetical protein [Streptomyces albireticuli]ARZ70343.1 hypothetical protein SMD11_4750 [Streptomyces albireticuli]